MKKQLNQLLEEMREELKDLVRRINLMEDYTEDEINERYDDYETYMLHLNEYQTTAACILTFSDRLNEIVNPKK